MRDEQLIQALRFCATRECDSCEMDDDCPNPSITELADRLEALLAENERLKAQFWVEYCQDMAEYSCPRIPRWVSAKERLPENDERVLALCRDYVIHDMQWNYPNWEWRDCATGSTYLGSFVTHWMPLPSTKEVE